MTIEEKISALLIRRDRAEEAYHDEIGKAVSRGARESYISALYQDLDLILFDINRDLKDLLSQQRLLRKETND